MNNAFKTQTSVHSMEQSDVARHAAHLRENSVMLAMTMLAQLLAFSALYLLPAAATAAWWGVLALAVPMAALCALACCVSRGMPENAFEKAGYRAVAAVFALLFLSDMMVDLLSMIELTCAFVLPNGSRLWLTLIAAVIMGMGTPHRSLDAAPRTARFLRGFFVVSFVFCAATVMQQGDVGYLFPWAGYGAAHTLRCAAMGCGACWMAGVLPIMGHREAGTAMKKAHIMLPLLAGMAGIGALLLCCAFVLPGTSLSGRWGFALRLQMLMNISPSTLAWSLMLISELLLFLLAFSAAGSYLCACVHRALRVRMPLWPMALLCVPLCLIGADRAESILMAVLPWRYAISLLLVCAVAALNLFARKKKAVKL